MDTDDLSKEAYKGIIIEAEKLTHDLTLHYGLLASECKNECEYIDKAERLTQAIAKLQVDELSDLFWGNLPDMQKLHFTLKRIVENIECIKAIPIDMRKFDF